MTGARVTLCSGGGDRTSPPSSIIGTIMRHYTGLTIDNIYLSVCGDALLRGDYVKTRGLMTKELLNVIIELYNPKMRFVTHEARDMNMRYFIGELCHYLDGRTDLASIAHYSKFWEKVSDDGQTINSCYGNRLFKRRYANEGDLSQFEYALQCLVKDKNSRKAIMMIYERQDARPSKDNPCTLLLQFIIRDDELYLYTNMRSQDIWLGVPYDFAFFTIVQEAAFTYLRNVYPNLMLGSYIHIVTSLHMYENNFESAKDLINNIKFKPIVAPDMINIDVNDWFDDLLTYEKYTRGKVLYKNESRRTDFQDWCKSYL